MTIHIRMLGGGVGHVAFEGVGGEESSRLRVILSHSGFVAEVPLVVAFVGGEGVGGIVASRLRSIAVVGIQVIGHIPRHIGDLRHISLAVVGAVVVVGFGSSLLNQCYYLKIHSIPSVYENK